MARRGEEGGEADLAFHRLTWKDAVEAGILPASEIVGAQKDLPPAVFRELYEAEASDDEGNPFGFAAIEACLRPGLSLLDPSVWGWDLAKSRDWTVGIGLDEIGDVSRFLRFQKPWKETLATIAEETGSLSALIDSTGVGDPIVEGLQRDHGSNFEGFRFSQSSKQRLMEGLAVAIQTGAVGFPDGPIRQELDEFEYRYTRTGVIYTAPPGFHDDCVIALALAVSYSSSGGRLATPDSLLVDDEPNEIEEIFRE
jgi:hypothetical protein